MPVYEGHLRTVIWQHHTHADTAHKVRQRLVLPEPGAHAQTDGPTHVDVFSHLDTREDAPHIDEMPLEIFCGPRDVPRHLRPRSARVLRRARAHALAESPVELRPGDILLLRTGTAERYGGTREYTRLSGLDVSAAAWLGEHAVKSFGVDSPSPDNPIDRIYPVHLFSRDQRVTLYESLANSRGRRTAIHVLRLPAADPPRTRLAGAPALLDE